MRAGRAMIDVERGAVAVAEGRVAARVVQDLDARGDVVGRAGAIAGVRRDGGGKPLHQLQHDVGLGGVRRCEAGECDVGPESEAVDPVHSDSVERRGAAQMVLLLFARAPSLWTPVIPFACVSCARSP